jgi:hypothetical protein
MAVVATAKQSHECYSRRGDNWERPMLYLIVKAVVSGLIIALASEIARRSPGWGALIISLPLISILSMIWLWRDTGDNERIAALAQGTFWLVLPTLPFFLALPALLRQGVAFWPAMTAACLMTVAFYLLAVWLLPKFGVSL